MESCPQEALSLVKQADAYQSVGAQTSLMRRCSQGPPGGVLGLADRVGAEEGLGVPYN